MDPTTLSDAMATVEQAAVNHTLLLVGAGALVGVAGAVAFRLYQTHQMAEADAAQQRQAAAAQRQQAQQPILV